MRRTDPRDSMVVSPAVILIAGNILSATQVDKIRIRIPRIIGINISTRRGFARAQMLRVSPGIMIGTNIGIRTTVATIVKGINAAEKLTSALAFLTRMGKNGATGAMLVINSPRAMDGSMGIIIVSSQAKAGLTTQPQPKVRTISRKLFRDLIVSIRLSSIPSDNKFETE
jgi:hypothetical protein